LRPVVPDIRQGKANHLAGLELPVFPEHGYILLSRDSVKKFMPKEKADTSPSSTPYPRT
jgi:hypothetical protein